MLLSLLLLLVGCTPTPSAPEPPPPRPVAFDVEPELEGLRLELSDAETPTTAGERVSRGAARPLADAEVQRLLSRVPELEPEDGDREPFRVRAGSLPPPRAGATVAQPWPPPDKPDAPDAAEPGPLKILRHAPEGPVPLAPHLSITFDQPMIAVTSQDAAAAQVPVRITPEPEGQWRWVGTRTLLFEPEPRFPMATSYLVSIPAGTRSAVGGVLAEAHEFAFQTPTPTLKHRWPNRSPVDLQPLIALGFDQAVAPEAVLERFELRPAAPVRLATTEEIAAWEEGAHLEAEVPERWVYLMPTEPLPRATSFTGVVRDGLGSLEGPETTSHEQSLWFETYHPLKLEEHRCAWHHDPCPVRSAWWLRFNNPLDPERAPAAITIDPPLEDANLYVNERYLHIDGTKAGRTTYTVTVAADLVDDFGQALGTEEVRTFEVGPADKALYGGGQGVLVLDPAAPPALSVYSTNHPRLRVRVHAVGPEDFGPFSKWMRERGRDLLHRAPMPGRKVAERTVTVDAAEVDRLVETALDLSPYLDEEGHGQLVVHVSSTTPPKHAWERQEVLQWVQATDLGVAAMSDAERLLVTASSLQTGAPLADVQLEVFPDGPSGASDARGQAELALLSEATGPQLLLARRGDDLALLPQSTGWWNDHAAWRAQPRKDAVRFFVFDDRGMYKPGEEVSVKGWIRRFETGPRGDLAALGDAIEHVNWRLNGPRGNVLSEGVVELSSLGGFHVRVTLPDEVNLGQAQLTLWAPAAETLPTMHHVHTFQVQEFRRPEFEVGVSVATEGPHVLGEHATLTASATYYAGGGLGLAPVYWHASSSVGSFVPPHRSDYQFGAFRPWWGRGYAGGGGHQAASHQAKTDSAGRHHLDVHFAALNPPRPMSVTVQASVTDVNRQQWTKSATMLVHPADRYIGVKPRRSFVRLGEPLEVDLLAVDLDGEVVGDADIEVVYERMVWGRHEGTWSERPRDAETCAVRSGQEAVLCSATPKKGGTWRVTATISDELGRPNQTQVRLWVTGGDAVPSRGVAQEEVLLVPNAKEYKAGDVAEIFVQAPFVPAHGTVSWRRSGVLHHEPVSLTEASTVLRVPIEDGHVPNLHVRVDLSGQQPRSDDAGVPQPDLPPRPAYAAGQLSLPVPPLARTLAVSVAPDDDALVPGGGTTLRVTVHDAAGAAVPGAEVALVAVDESVLALSGHQIADPVAAFYAARGAGVGDYALRSMLLLADPASATLASRGQGLGSVGVGSSGFKRKGESARRSGARQAPAAAEVQMASGVVGGFASFADGDTLLRSNLQFKQDANKAMPDTPIAVRENFDALALFSPAVATGADGSAAVSLDLPDSLTRYRITAVAVDATGKRFGKDESAITARNPVMLRPSPPRFLNFGDRAELPLVVQNQTDEPQQVQVAIRALNASFLDALPSDPRSLSAAGEAWAGQSVTVPASDRVELRFPVATDMAGTARFQAAVAAGDFADAASFDVPVWTPATSEAFATYGTLDEGAVAQPVEAPPDVWSSFGGLEITTSSTALQALTDAVLYLNAYPYECHEQLSSRLLANAALRDVLAAFEADGLPEPEALSASVARDLEVLAQRQNPDGGWAFWRRGDPSWPYLTLHVAHAMARAEQKGAEPDANMRSSALTYLQRIEQHIPGWYTPYHRYTIEAYAVYVRRLLGDADVGKALEVYGKSGDDGLAMEGLGWLLPTLHAGGRTSEVQAILHYIGNHTTETAAGAHFVNGVSDGAEHVLLHSDRRVDGVLLEALIEVDPETDLIPKVVNGLLAHRTKGRWGNTQENAFVLVALDRYFARFEGVEPDFVARAWLGDGFAGEHAFRGRSTERARIDVPMGYLTEHAGARDLLIAKEGPGRLYYRVGLRYAPKSLELEPADRGFALERRYEGVDDPDDVRRDVDGTWRIRAGARVRVQLTMATPMRRYHVALVDPLPAGLEVLNPALAVTGALPDNPAANSSGGRYWWWSRTWYEHENMRDERVEAFASLLWDGVHSYSYLARATTPGQFVVPPTRAEEMYSPETFGRGATERVVVE